MDMEVSSVTPASYCTAVYQAMLRRNLADSKATTTEYRIGRLPTSPQNRTSANNRVTHQRLSFWELPAEIRNMIYQLALTTDDTDNEERDYIDLLDAHPPTKSLLLVCRGMNNEARGLYKAAYRAYWSKNSFIAHRALEPPENNKRLSSLTSQAVQSITSLRIMIWESASNVRMAKHMITERALIPYSDDLRKDFTFQTDGTLNLCVITPRTTWPSFSWPSFQRHYKGRFVRTADVPWWRIWDVENWITVWLSSPSVTRKIPLPLKEQVDIIMAEG